eukprot:scaffold7066_cov253-Pinguiococcus_pyrenoidosus.AAC.35
MACKAVACRDKKPSSDRSSPSLSESSCAASGPSFSMRRIFRNCGMTSRDGLALAAGCSGGRASCAAPSVASPSFRLRFSEVACASCFIGAAFKDAATLDALTSPEARCTPLGLGKGLCASEASPVRISNLDATSFQRIGFVDTIGSRFGFGPARPRFFPLHTMCLLGELFPSGSVSVSTLKETAMSPRLLLSRNA